MSNNLIRRATWATAMSLAVAIFPNSVQSSHPEPEAMCDEGVIIEPVGMNYGEHTVGCLIDDVTDLDSFVFDGVEMESVRLIVRSFTTFDPRIEVRDPFGVIIDNTACSGACTLRRDLVLPETGTYTVAITDSNSDNTGGYSFQLERVLPPIPGIPGLNYDVSVLDNIDFVVTDVDFFAFMGEAGTDVRVVVRSFTTFDPRLEIWDPTDTSINNTACSGACTLTSDFSLAVSGLYLVAISDSNSDNTGSYEIGIDCLFPAGECPDVIQPVACNIELSQPVYLENDTVTADVFGLANPDPDADPTAVEWKVWLEHPSAEPQQIVSVGDDGTIVLPGGADLDFGPLPIFPVGPTTERGDYALNCRLLDPTTGRQKALDINTFEVSD